MMLLENIKMAFISLRNAKLRSFLTMLGIIIGVTAVISIVAIGDGVKANISSEIASLGSNVLAISPGQISSGNVASSLGTSTLTQPDIVTIKQTPHIINTSYLSPVSGIVSRNGTKALDAITLATTSVYSKITSPKLSEGSFFTATQETEYVAVIGSQIEEELFGKDAANGKTISLRGQTFTVVGVLEKQDTGLSVGPSQNSQVLIPVAAARNITGVEPSIFRIITQVDDTKNVDTTVKSLKASIKKNHGGQDDFSVLTQKDLLSTVNTILNLLTTFVVAIASISLLVGGIGIMNIMLVSVTERTREIGLRKAIGASSSMVLSQFLIEAVVISVIGGALGILGAIGLANLAGGLAHITPVFTLSSISIAVGVSAAVGIVFGIAPAIKAARKQPIQALKSE